MEVLTAASINVLVPRTVSRRPSYQTSPEVFPGWPDGVGWVWGLASLLQDLRFLGLFGPRPTPSMVLEELVPLPVPAVRSYWCLFRAAVAPRWSETRLYAYSSLV